MLNEILSWILDNCISIVSLFISAGSVYYARKANTISENANDKADEANNIAKDANKLGMEANDLSSKANVTANQANELSRQSVFYEYYNNLDKIDRQLTQVEEYVVYQKDVLKALDSIETLCLDIQILIESGQMFPFPIGTNNVFSELYDGCKKIEKRIKK